jgi:CHAD domain-containing protein
MAKKKLPKEMAPAAAVAAGGAAIVAGAAGLRRRSSRQRERERRYRIRRGEPADDGLRRVARGQIDLAEEHLARGDAVGLHEARKALKRLRTAVRLGRRGLGADTARRENRAFRDAGRRLAGARDAHVLLATLDDLSRRYEDELPPERFEALRAALAEADEAAVASVNNGDGGRAAARTELRAARSRVAGWTLDDEEGGVLVDGLRRIYRRGRRAHRAARAEPTTQALHEWRKRVKDLWHAAQLLRPAAPKVLKPLARDAHQLSNVLGEDHDLAVLRADALRRRAECFPEPAELEALTGLIDRRRAELRERAFALGAKVYGRKPGKLAARVARGWKRRIATPAAA